MTTQQITDSMAYCGLICCLCRPDGGCDCHSCNHCGKRLSPDGCYQYACCTQKGLNGCWECDLAPCGQDMHAEGKTKIRAFITCIREDGLDQFAQYLARNADAGIVYHHDGSIYGDYDLETEADVLSLLRNGPAK